MAQTLATYTTLVQNEVDSASDSSTTVIQQHIKEIYQDIFREDEVHRVLVGTSSETHTLTAGTSTVTPSAFLEIIDVQVQIVGATTYRPMFPISEQEYLKFHLNDGQASPSWYYVKGSNIEVVPAPASADTLRVTYRPVVPELETGVTSLIPDRYNEVVKAGCDWKFQKYNKDPSTIESKAYYDEAKAKMIRELGNRYEPVDIPLYGARPYVKTSAEAISK